MKHINTYILSKIKNETNITEKLQISKTKQYTLFPEDIDELREMITDEIRKNGISCSLNHIDVSEITNMINLFYESDFNGDISQWDVSNVTNMNAMFYNSKFNGDISEWDVSNVTNMKNMFRHSKFNGDISVWNVSKVINMECMFFLSKFNQDISNWNISNVKNMTSMFAYGIFNHNISKWEINPKCKVNGILFECPIKNEYKPYKDGERL
jgi:surface protein